MQRERFGSRFGVLVAMAGSAVGLGNFWRFPYLMGEHGGAAFVLVYIIFALLLCMPIFIAEFLMGRRSQQNSCSTFYALSGKKIWKRLGFITVLTPFVILSYYCVVGGWSLYYLFKAIALDFTSHTSQESISTMFTTFVSSVYEPFLCHAAFLVIVAVIVAKGVKGGIEKFSKLMMPALFVLVIIMAFYSISLPGAEGGIEYMFKADFSKLDKQMYLDALGQAFFSMTVGGGVIMTYGSYVSKKENILTQSIATTISDLIFAIIAGLVIIPAVFAFGVDPQSGPGLVFETLPFIFSQMPGGVVVAIFFFIALLLAAVTSAISLMEVPVTYVADEMKMSRKSACVVLTFIIWFIGALCSLSFGPLSDVKIFGRTFFDFFDFFSSNILLTVSSLLIVLFVGWVMKRSDVYQEFTNNEAKSLNVKMFRLFYIVIRYVAPIVVVFLLLVGVLN